MGASVRIEDEAFSDERYEDLAAAAGLTDADHARGKMLKLWRQCTLETRYVLPRETVLRILGDRGIDALVIARLGEVVDDGVRMRGTKGRIEWLQKLRKNGRFGKRGGRPKKNPPGFTGEPMRVSNSATNETPPAPAPAPAPAPGSEKSSASRKRSAASTPEPRATKPPVAGHTETIAYFHDRFKRAYGTEPTWNGLKAKAINGLVATHGQVECCRRIDVLFDGGLAWPHPPYDLDTYVKHFDKLAINGRRTNGAQTGRVEPMKPHEYGEGDLKL